MDFSQLRYFQTVARCESMTKAAEELHITQSALSKVIARLESELGVQLFTREHKRLILNQNGVRLLQFSISSFEALDRCLAGMAQEETKNITAMVTNSNYMSTQLMACTAEYPDLEIEVIVDTPNNCFGQLESRKANLAILPMPSDVSAGWEPLYQERWCLILHSLRLPQIHHHFASIQDAAQFPLAFCGDSGSFRFLLRAFERHELTPSFVLQTESMAQLMQLAASSRAVGVVPYNVFYQLKRMEPEMPLHAVPLEDGNLQRNVYIRRTPDYPSGERAEAFYQALRRRMIASWQQTMEYMDGYFSSIGAVPPVD